MKKVPKHRKTEIVFDASKRADFLTGFRKRKDERRKKAKEQAENELREEKRIARLVCDQKETSSKFLPQNRAKRTLSAMQFVALLLLSQIEFGSYRIYLLSSTFSVCANLRQTIQNGAIFAGKKQRRRRGRESTQRPIGSCRKSSISLSTTPGRLILTISAPILLK